MKFLELKKSINETAIPKYNETIEEIKKLQKEIEECDGTFKPFLSLIAGKILKADQFKEEYNDNYFKHYDLKELAKFNSEIYSEVLAENYETSFANPAYAVAQYGDKIGQLLSAIYISYRSYFSHVVNFEISELAKKNQLFLDIVASMKADKKDYDSIFAIYKDYVMNLTLEEKELNTRSTFDPDNYAFGKIVMEADLSDIRYLYQYGKYITENEIKTAQFLNKYPEDKILKLTDELTKAFIRGFELAKKDLSIKETVLIVYNLGQERIVRQLAKNLEDYNLKPLFSRASSTVANKQYGYDHRFDSAMVLDREYTDKLIIDQDTVSEICSDVLTKYAGVVAFDAFGEKPFSPKAKAENLKLSEEQQKFSQQLNIARSKTSQKYMPRTETSFCIIGFPVPEIGPKFEEIFEATSDINMIDTLHWEEIQQKIVDVMDQAEYVHVKGKNGNKTDIKVKMQKLADPDKHTNFVNCGADVNIPVGEVFTSPMLEGTNGILHVQESFLNNITFKELELHFKDGYVEEYTCGNMENEEENKKLIQEDLLFPHKTLPLGEFAIGTNTPAYVMAKKFDILNLLPILIVEKMGPHFAIGDTCFSWEEDFAVFNPIDGKEITARENTHSAKRKTDIQEAYTNCHTDITLPYEDLDFIVAITADGKEIDIIRDGRFAVPGTEELNQPLEEFGV